MSREGVYRSFLRPLLFMLDPEAAHNLAMHFLASISTRPILLRSLRRFQPPPNPVTLFGVKFPNRVGLAAGFDKNGVALPAWAAMGFGFVEIGTVTARPQPGNPKPRIFRYPRQQALINRLGFNNDGADVVANRLRRWQERDLWPEVPVGINIGKSKTAELEHATADYLHSFRRLQRFADYIVLNVSSPNTPGLRSLQEAESLDMLLRGIQEENRMQKPILVKIAPDLSPDSFDDVVNVCGAHNVAAIIAANTTLDHGAIASDADQAGGLSGAPLREKSTRAIRTIVANSAIPVIGCGGIM
ncbi:MAG TPA: quinone-dependent dihydroorotate dehydrogenase, partial [Chthoniobacterales bacterium]|nr:quinone-dependent dihydroorotate dehydrogenase [Chthoniobacterales bacterium]